MAAPSGTKWSSASTGTQYQGRVGLYVTTSSSNTQTTVKAQLWYWSQYSCQDSSNTFYFNWEKTSASSSVGSKNINTGSNNGWNKANQVKVAEYSKTYNRGTSDKSYSCAARFTGIEYGGGSSHTATASYKVPARTRYTVSYNANGGSGAPGSQTKYYGDTLTLSNTRPTRSGYTFLGWGTSAGDTSVDYSPGGKYTANASATLYAIWQLNQYNVTFDAGTNGGTVNGSQLYGITVDHGYPLGDLPVAVRPGGYEFIGWWSHPNGGIKVADDYLVYKDERLYARFELQANCYIKQNGVYKMGMLYHKQTAYNTGLVSVKSGGVYKPSNM